MGAPKQKWTAEEEAALKAGVRKHGTGKWRTILMDPEFSSLLCLRSNVDLKDKWRNINVTAIWGSRQKAKLALKRTKHDENSKAMTIAHGSDEENGSAKPRVLSNGTRKNGFSRDLLARLDNIVLEAIATLEEPGGSDKASVISYVEEKYEAHPNLRKLLVGKLKFLTATGKLIKVKHKYRIASSAVASEGRKNFPLMLTEGKLKDPFKLENDIARTLTKSQVDQDLHKIRGMAAEEAAAAAAKAVVEAEAAIAEAEAAAREAEAAEVEAEAAKVFEEAAIKAFKYGTCQISKW